MAFDNIRALALRGGKTVPVVLNQLPGEPVVDVEHLGESNESYLNDQIAQANSKASAQSGGGKVSKKRLAEMLARRRSLLAKHGIRHLKAKHSDGKDATDADIPDFVDALPPDLVGFLWDFASNPENFRDHTIESTAKDLAEK